MTVQRTRFNNIQSKAFEFVTTTLVGPWRRRSISLISLLLGFYFTSNLSVFFLAKTGQRILVAIIMIILIEILIRLRSLVKSKEWPLHWLAIDNLRIGTIYAIVLEAYKLGS